MEVYIAAFTLHPLKVMHSGEITIDDRSLLLAPAVGHEKAQTLITQKLDAKKKVTGAEVWHAFDLNPYHVPL